MSRPARTLSRGELLIAALIVGAVLAVAQWISPWLMPWVLGWLLASMGNNLRAMCLNGPVSAPREPS